ncbi:hypothetical protein D3C87_2075000 [compost metagenome]
MAGSSSRFLPNMDKSRSLAMKGAKIRNTKWHFGHSPHQRGPSLPLSRKLRLQLEKTASNLACLVKREAMRASE